jgi:hypothetical protein
MILTPVIIDQMRRYMPIDARLERMLLKQLGKEPYPHSYTEQDIHEQSRKMINRYNEGSAATKTASKRLWSTRQKKRRDQEEIF